MALVDYFLEIDGVPGESTDLKHKDEIEVESWSWGATQLGTTAVGGGGGAGKVSIQDLNFVARTSKASPTLFLRCASGEHIKQAILTARKAGKDQSEFLILTMSDVLVTSYQIAGSETADTVPMDQVSVNFTKIKFEYRTQRPDGSLDAPVWTGWDSKANQKL